MSGEQREEGIGEGGEGKKTGRRDLNLSLTHSQHQLDINAIHLRDFVFKCLFGFLLITCQRKLLLFWFFFRVPKSSFVLSLQLRVVRDRWFISKSQETPQAALSMPFIVLSSLTGYIGREQTTFL